MQRRMAQLPLHGGKAPPWLFKRMTRLAGAVTTAIVEEFGPREMLLRLADPWWFQAFGCVLGFDWHSSGVTTVTCGALKEAYKQRGADLGIVVAGGKGAAGRRTPDEIRTAADRFAIASGEKLEFASRMSAKVDSAAVQDGFSIYHHSFFLIPQGGWCVVQQGMSDASRTARRYHWLGESVDDFVCEPHSGIENVERLTSPGTKPANGRLFDPLNLVASEGADNRRAAADLVAASPDWLWEQIDRYTLGPTLFAPHRHRVLDLDVNRDRLRKLVVSAHEQHPHDFGQLVALPGIGAATLRALALLAEIIYEAPASRRDPAELISTNPDEPHTFPSQGTRRWADYSYAHGGKDGTPFPVDRATYDQSIAVLEQALRQARLGANERVTALKKLACIVPVS